jgi:serine/threonine protein kinase
MGVVYHAQQTQPIRRDVALKVIKPGMDSKQVIARFDSERQALAMMDHTNIARVFDAGTTAANATLGPPLQAVLVHIAAPSSSHRALAARVLTCLREVHHASRL